MGREILYDHNLLNNFILDTAYNFLINISSVLSVKFTVKPHSSCIYVLFMADVLRKVKRVLWMKRLIDSSLRADWRAARSLMGFGCAVGLSVGLADVMWCATTRSLWHPEIKVMDRRDDCTDTHQPYKPLKYTVICVMCIASPCRPIRTNTAMFWKRAVKPKVLIASTWNIRGKFTVWNM